MGKNFFRFGKKLCARADARLDNRTIKELWRGFTCQMGEAELTEDISCTFAVGAVELPKLSEGSEYSIKVSETGIAVRGRDYKALARAVMVLMMRIEPESLKEGGECFRIECCELEGRYLIENRMIHFCVFPETSLSFIKKCIRLAGVMQYTHVVLEFWGMLKFDCMKELSWSNAFSKSEAKELIEEISDMGMEAVPMFNHLGHASACRVSGGKHVVLDQNPSLSPLFSPDGWSWNIDSDESFELLKKVRQELYELFPESGYFHLGCDEVYSYEDGEDDQRRMREYLRKLTETVHAEGRRPIIWGDMLLNREALSLGSEYFCSCERPEYASMLIDALPKYTVIGDWHYDIFKAPVKTGIFLKQQGFDVLGVPWFEYDNCAAHTDTVRENALMGIMVSTWHTLAQNMPQIVYAALLFGAYRSPWSGPSRHKTETETAALLRKVMFVKGDYREAGWTDSQIFMQARPMV